MQLCDILRGLATLKYLPRYLNYVHNAAVYRQQQVLSTCDFPFLTSFINTNTWFRFWNFNFNILHAFTRNRKGMMGFCAAKKKQNTTFVLFSTT
jgi:hypothetical protein